MNESREQSTILVIEDEEPLRKLLTIMLQRAGHRVLSAANGNEAFELWKRSGDTIELLITDVALGGGMTGEDVARELRKRRADLPIIFASGNLPDAIGENLKAMFHAMYIMKPFSLTELSAAVESSLRAAAHE